MKKLFLLIMTVIMISALVACGGNNDENNAAVQTKIDEYVALSQEVINWYVDSGLLDGEHAERVQAIIDKLSTQVDDIKAAHQENLDSGGYSDKIVNEKIGNIDDLIENYNKMKEEQNATQP